MHPDRCIDIIIDHAMWYDFIKSYIIFHVMGVLEQSSSNSHSAYSLYRKREREKEREREREREKGSQKEKERVKIANEILQNKCSQ